MQLFCTACGNIFYEEEGLIEEREFHPEVDSFRTETFLSLICPFCGADVRDLIDVRELESEDFFNE